MPWFYSPVQPFFPDSFHLHANSFFHPYFHPPTVLDRLPGRNNSYYCYDDTPYHNQNNNRNDNQNGSQSSNNIISNGINNGIISNRHNTNDSNKNNNNNNNNNNVSNHRYQPPPLIRARDVSPAKHMGSRWSSPQLPAHASTESLSRASSVPSPLSHAITRDSSPLSFMRTVSQIPDDPSPPSSPTSQIPDFSTSSFRPSHRTVSQIPDPSPRPSLTSNSQIPDFSSSFMRTVSQIPDPSPRSSPIPDSQSPDPAQILDPLSPSSSSSSSFLPVTDAPDPDTLSSPFPTAQNLDRSQFSTTLFLTPPVPSRSLSYPLPAPESSRRPAQAPLLPTFESLNIIRPSSLSTSEPISSSTLVLSPQNSSAVPPTPQTPFTSPPSVTLSTLTLNSTSTSMDASNKDFLWEDMVGPTSPETNRIGQSSNVDINYLNNILNKNDDNDDNDNRRLNNGAFNPLNVNHAAQAKEATSRPVLNNNNPPLPTPPPQRHVTVLSFNVLAQTYLLRHQHQLYSLHSPAALKWERRREIIIDEILSKNPDVVCLQEVEGRHFHDFFSPVLAKYGFVGRFNPRCRSDDDNDGNDGVDLDGSGGGGFVTVSHRRHYRFRPDKPDGVALFYRADKFNLLEFLPVDMNKGVDILSRDNVAVIVVLEPIVEVDRVDERGFHYPSYDPLVVATTHLLFNPKRGDIKLAQLAVILAELEWISRRRGRHHHHHHLPIVFCGDMNFEPFCPLFDFVVDGFVRYGGVDVKSLIGDIENSDRAAADRADAAGDDRLKRTGRIFEEPTLLPPSLGITEDCRKIMTPSFAVDNAAADADSTKEKDSGVVAVVDRPPGDGFLYHCLDLKSAYHMDYRKPKERRDNDGDGDDRRRVDAAREYMTTHHDRSSANLDFIFFNESRNFELVRTSPLPKAGSVPMIPNDKHGSDHFSVAATFALTAQDKYYQF